MGVYDGPSPIQFLENGIEHRIAEILETPARCNTEAIGLQNIESVCDFLQSLIDLRQRQRCPQPETPRIITHHFRAEFVGIAAAVDEQFLACFASQTPNELSGRN